MDASPQTVHRSRCALQRGPSEMNAPLLPSQGWARGAESPVTAKQAPWRIQHLPRSGHAQAIMRLVRGDGLSALLFVCMNSTQSENVQLKRMGSAGRT